MGHLRSNTLSIPRENPFKSGRSCRSLTTTSTARETGWQRQNCGGRITTWKACMTEPTTREKASNLLVKWPPNLRIRLDADLKQLTRLCIFLCPRRSHRCASQSFRRANSRSMKIWPWIPAESHLSSLQVFTYDIKDEADLRLQRQGDEAGHFWEPAVSGRFVNLHIFFGGSAKRTTSRR